MRSLLLLLSCAACAPPAVLGPAAIFEDVAAPLEYRAELAQGGQEVRGEACQTGFFLPLIYNGILGVAWGQGGYADAMRDAQAKAKGASLTDVRADVHSISVLTIFRQQCVVVTAAASK